MPPKRTAPNNSPSLIEAYKRAKSDVVANPDVMQMIHNRMNNVSTGRLATVFRTKGTIQSMRHLKVFRITNRTKIPKQLRAYSDEPLDQAMLRVHQLSRFSTVHDPLMVNARNRIRRLVQSGSKVTPSMIQRYITVALTVLKVPQKESNAILRGMMERAKPTNSATKGIQNVNTLRHLHSLGIPIGGEAFKHDFLSFLKRGQRSRYYATFMYRLMQDPSAGFKHITELLFDIENNESFPYFAHFLFEGVTHLTPALATASDGSKFDFLFALLGLMIDNYMCEEEDLDWDTLAPEKKKRLLNFIGDLAKSCNAPTRQRIMEGLVFVDCPVHDGLPQLLNYNIDFYLDVLTTLAENGCIPNVNQYHQSGLWKRWNVLVKADHVHSSVHPLQIRLLATWLFNRSKMVDTPAMRHLAAFVNPSGIENVRRRNFVKSILPKYPQSNNNNY